MRDKLEKIIKAYEELEKKLSDPAVASDIKEFTRLNKEYAHQSDLIAASREYISALDDIEAAKEMLRDTTDADEKEMLQMDVSENEDKLPQLVRIGVDDGVGHRLADGGFDVPDLVQRWVQLGGKGRRRHAGKALVGAAAEKFQGHIVFGLHLMYLLPIPR